ncbi:hypothetical protein [Prevotella sp. HUN102]|uniref:hypothetical protein n=1 Tax=Prevotella sp. HUN102 TaxID=1392486 RepID=UPI0012DE35B7|nr:hypothetical protein [Prevotella sp. HUN102]
MKKELISHLPITRQISVFNKICFVLFVLGLLLMVYSAYADSEFLIGKAMDEYSYAPMEKLSLAGEIISMLSVAGLLVSIYKGMKSVQAKFQSGYYPVVSLIASVALVLYMLQTRVFGLCFPNYMGWPFYSFVSAVFYGGFFCGVVQVLVALYKHSCGELKRQCHRFFLEVSGAFILFIVSLVVLIAGGSMGIVNTVLLLVCVLSVGAFTAAYEMMKAE